MRTPASRRRREPKSDYIHGIKNATIQLHFNFRAIGSRTYIKIAIKNVELTAIYHHPDCRRRRRI